MPEHFVHVPQASKCHLGTNPAPLWLDHVIQLPLEGPRDTEAILLEFALPLYLPSAKDMLPVSYLHLSAFISQPLALVPAFCDRLKSSLETGVFFC